MIFLTTKRGETSVFCRKTILVETNFCPFQHLQDRVMTSVKTEYQTVSFIARASVLRATGDLGPK